jgi:hypothetical protein
MTRTHYEDRLLAELRALVEQNAATAPPPRGVRRRRPRLVVAGVAGGACAATALIAFAGGDDGSTAYAVDRRDDGSVTVEIKALADAAGLERELRAAGVPAEVDYLPLGQMCREGRFKPAAPGGRSSGGMAERADGSVSFTISAGQLQRGQTLVITSSGGRAQGVTSVAMAVAQGAVAPCEPVKAPGLPDPEPSGAPAAPERGTTEADGAGARLDSSGTSSGGE